eukprot:scaffold332307_cov47-Prasinocladus_malaysianus.AAC.1
MSPSEPRGATLRTVLVALVALCLIAPAFCTVSCSGGKDGEKYCADSNGRDKAAHKIDYCPQVCQKR